MRLFLKDADFEAFEGMIAQTLETRPMRIMAHCLMPSHWHLLVWPATNGELSRYLHWLTMTHTQRWHAHHHTVGTGPLYQGRFKKAPAMFKNAPGGGLNKRGRTHPVHDANRLVAHLDPLY